MDFDPADQFRRLNRSSVEHGFKAITNILERNSAALTRFAKRRLRRKRVPEVEYEPADLLQSASRTVLQDVLEGKIGNIDDESGVLRIVRRIIADKVAAKLKQIRTAKRDRFRLTRLVNRRREIGAVTRMA